MTIMDEIDFLDREYRIEYRGAPTAMKISPENLALLREELGMDEDDDIVSYHGMYLEVDEMYDEIELCSYEEI